VSPRVLSVLALCLGTLGALLGAFAYQGTSSAMYRVSDQARRAEAAEARLAYLEWWYRYACARSSDVNPQARQDPFAIAVPPPPGPPPVLMKGLPSFMSRPLPESWSGVPAVDPDEVHDWSAWGPVEGPTPSPLPYGPTGGFRR